MRHFVRFAKVAPNGSVDRNGWRLRIFLSAIEAGAFARAFGPAQWRVETGQYEDGEREAPAGLVRRLRAQTLLTADPAARR